jgi:micrococcal nuclease
MKGNLKTPIIITISLVVLALIIVISLKLLSNQNSFPQPNNETAIYIVDGDTFETSDGETIRLLCIDTPEVNQNGYEEAKNYLSSLILSEDIIIEREGFDSYNRTLAWVSVYNEDESILVNKAIVDNGYGSLFVYNGSDCERMNFNHNIL